MKRYFFILLLLAISFNTSHVANCQPSDTLVVAVHQFSPLVMKSADHFIGFDIDIWDAIAKDLCWTYKIKEIAEFENIFTELTDNQVDVALAGITINAERECVIDFSQHYLDSGLQILVPADKKMDLFGSLASVFNIRVLKLLVVLALFILVGGVVIWLFDRGSDNEIVRPAFPGILQGCWCVVTTMTTVGYGDIAPSRWMARLMALLVMLVGIGLFGWIAGEFAAVATIERLESDIQSPGDLAGKKVATLKASTSVQTLRDLRAIVTEINPIDEAYALLEGGKVDAVVFDSPNLKYYSNNDGMGKVSVVGEIFEPQYYGIAFPQGSPLRESVNRSLLKLKTREFGDSQYDRIYRHWFGR